MKIHEQDLDPKDNSILDQIRNIDNQLTEIINELIEEYPIGYFENSGEFVLFEGYDIDSLTDAIKHLKRQGLEVIKPYIEKLGVVETKLKINTFVDIMVDNFGGNHNLPKFREIINIHANIPLYIERKDELFRAILDDLADMFNQIDNQIDEALDNEYDELSFTSTDFDTYFNDVNSLFEFCDRISKLFNNDFPVLDRDSFHSHSVELDEILKFLPSIKKVLIGTFLGDLLELSKAAVIYDESTPEFSIYVEEEE